MRSEGKTEAVENNKITFEEELVRHGSIVFINKGNSMMPLLREDKDLMVITRRPVDSEGNLLRCKKYDVILYKRGSSYILHRILKVLPEGYVICGDHNWRREYDIREEQILGVLTSFVRDGAETQVTNRRYMCYVHLWCDFFPIRALLLRLKTFFGRIKRKIKRKIKSGK